MSVLDEMNAFVGSSVSDTGLLATAFVITFRDGSDESFNGTLSDFDSDDEGLAVMLHCELTEKPELMDRVVSSEGCVYHISDIKKDVDVYSLTLVCETRYVR